MRSRSTSPLITSVLTVALSSCAAGSGGRGDESDSDAPTSGGAPAGGGGVTGGNGTAAGGVAAGPGTGGLGALPLTGGASSSTSGGTGNGPATGGIVGTGNVASGGATTGGAATGSVGNATTGGVGDGATGGAGNATSGGATPTGGSGNVATGGVDSTPTGGGGNAVTGGAGTGGGAVLTGTQYLSDLCDVGSSNGWGPVERDLSNGEQEAGDGGPIIINGQAFGKGLGMHAPAEMTFDLAGSCSAFQADVGVDEEMKGAGSVVFQVWGDDAMLYESSSLAGWEGPVPVDVDITGVQSLRLVADDSGGNGSDHADWGDARIVCADLSATACTRPNPGVAEYPGWTLVWSDEFDVEGRPNPDNWGYESGMVRNNEWQYYTDQNATVVAGFLIIQGRRESYQGADYTSSSLRTMNDNWTPKQAFQYGRFEMRARVVAEPGMWPAFWTLGTGLGNWPFNGEIDIMEYYNDRVHANVASSNSTDQNAYDAKWAGSDRPVSEFGITDWDARFHVWRMDWDSERIVLSIDDYVMNDVLISSMLNADGTNPFAQTHYILVNLAIGGDAGGDASGTHFPVHYVVDFVRVYQQD
jgi:beta-glucanase (GH16 family)